MNRRRRVLAGGIALLAMTFSFAETVAASTCAPTMAMAPEAADMDHGPPARDGMAQIPAAGTHENDGADERECPYAPLAGAQGCAAAASLPAQCAQAPTPSPEAASTVPSVDGRHDLLLQSALFHPPRA